MKVLLVIYVILLSYPVHSLEYQVKNNGTVDAIPAINIAITLKPQLFEDNFTFNNQLTLHHSEHFNLLITANITQTTTFEQSSTSDNKLIPSSFLPNNELSHQYGLIGSYSLTPKWQVSGGLIYSKPSFFMGNEQSNINNVALIGTSYSF
jgi:hypothetical protein